MICSLESAQHASEDAWGAPIERQIFLHIVKERKNKFRSIVRGQLRRSRPVPGNGGAGRDRTDDLKLAKLALSQLSYGPNAKIGAAASFGSRRKNWWAWEDLNFRPHAYQARALTS